MSWSFPSTHGLRFLRASRFSFSFLAPPPACRAEVMPKFQQLGACRSRVGFDPSVDHRLAFWFCTSTVYSVILLFSYRLTSDLQPGGYAHFQHVIDDLQTIFLMWCICRQPCDLLVPCVMRLCATLSFLCRSPSLQQGEVMPFYFSDDRVYSLESLLGYLQILLLRVGIISIVPNASFIICLHVRLASFLHGRLCQFFEACLGSVDLMFLYKVSTDIINASLIL